MGLGIIQETLPPHRPKMRVERGVISVTRPALLSLWEFQTNTWLVCRHIFGPSSVQGTWLASVDTKGTGLVAAAIRITRTAKICLIHSSTGNSLPC